MEWVVVLGLQGIGFIFKDVLLKLLQGTLEDYVKDFFKTSIGDLVALTQEKPTQKAFGLALKEFLGLFQQTLEDADLSPTEIEHYKSSLEKYLKDPRVLENLGTTFEKALGSSDRDINATALSEIWLHLDLEPLPDEFDWLKLARRYSRKVENILRESADLHGLLDSKNLAQMRQIQEETAAIAPDFDVSEYRKKVQTAFRRLRLDSLDTSGWTYRLQLEKMFVPQPISSWPNSQEIFPKAANALLTSRGYKYTMILGNPGSGKSTLLQYRALWWANLPPKKWPQVELPLLIELRNYIANKRDNHCNSFLEYLHKGTGVTGGTLHQRRLKEWMETHKTLVMFDGLDEVLERGHYLQIIEDIVNFTHDFPKVRVVVTSRIVGYQPQRFLDSKFRHFLLRDLGDKEIMHFLQAWHRLAFEDSQEGEKKKERLQKSIETSSTFRELAGNPLLLTMMAILNRNEKLPKDRPTLYERASEVLLQRWDADRNIEDEDLDDRLKALNYQDKQEMLRRIAYRMYEQRSRLDETSERNLLLGREELLGILSDYLKELGVEEAQLAARSLLEPLAKRSFILSFMGGISR